MKYILHIRNSRYRLAWTIPIVKLLQGRDTQEAESFPSSDCQSNFLNIQYYYEMESPTPRSEILTVKSFEFAGLPSIRGRTGNIEVEERASQTRVSNAGVFSVSIISRTFVITTSILFG